jgi:hypothetical protein
MAAGKPRTRKGGAPKKQQKRITVVGEVETLEDLAPRMQELTLDLPEGSRIYLRVRNQRTVH